MTQLPGLFKVRASYKPTAEIDAFVGEQGELFYSEGDTRLRISDGKSPGGIIISSLTGPQGALAVTESDVTAHQAALSITESQISDFGTYLTSVAFTDLTTTPTTLSDYGITDASTTTQMNIAISTAIDNLVDTAPGTLDTLNELAEALGDDANFSTTISNQIGTKLDASHDMSLTLSGDASGSATFTNMGNATLTVTVADDSHNHTITNVDGLQTALDGKLSTSGKAADSELLDGINSTSFLRSDQNDTIDAGTNTTLTILSDDTGASTLQLYGSAQGTGRVYVGQSASYGGSIEYNGDNSPTSTGAGADYVTLWRRAAGVDNWTARNYYNNNDWEFRGNVSAVNFNGVASSAKYADLAENYLADSAYSIGTVLDIGGNAEVTIATKDSYRIAGTVSEKPGYLMNSAIKGEYVTPVAYVGRVPCRVEGVVHRGDMLVVGDTPGVAVAKHPRDILPGQAIGKALESYNNLSEGLIEILVGRL